MLRKKTARAGLLSAVCLVLASQAGAAPPTPPQRIGVLYAVHGGATTWGPQKAWDSSAQMFYYDANSFGYKNIIWNPTFWPLMLTDPNGLAQSRKYDFEYPRIGGQDPYDTITDTQLAQMTTALNVQAALYKLKTRKTVSVFTGRMSWISDDPADLPNPRGMYNPQVAGGAALTYCGGPADGGPWAGCDPQRYNVDGAVERMLANDISRLIVVDTTTSGVRFWKTFEQLSETRKVVNAYNTANGKNVTVEWVNDPSNLMLDSYPTAPANWTSSLGAPTADAAVPLTGRPNPFTEDPALAWIQVVGIAKAINTSVPLADTAVVLMNHHVGSNKQWFDPKIDDTLVLNRNIRQALRRVFPKIAEQNIVGAWFGRSEVNPNIIPRPPTFSQLERTRAMRGENLGEAWLYETHEALPQGLDGYQYWDALEELKNRGIKHIIIAFPQIMSESVLSLVEIPNQIAKEIGFKNWLYWSTKDYDTYPGVGHPFAAYWGNWANTQCKIPGSTATEACCFAMGGCPASTQPYPPLRQSAATSPISALDPNLAYAVSEYGHLGYDPGQGAPDVNAPVQNQYTGTWALWTPPSDSPLLGTYLGAKVWKKIVTP
ncbi:MAG: hypothetical protein R3F27_03345 [Gammaproteobacteria bacterium]